MGEIKRRARMKDVAAHAGVSQALVSRLLNNDPALTVREETREAVMRAVADLGYIPDSTATALRKSRTNAIGLVLDHVTNPIFTEMVRGAQQAASEVGCTLLLVDADTAEEDSSLFSDIIGARRIDGLLLQGGYGNGDARIQQYSELLPSVVVNSHGNSHASGVSLQDERATWEATRHLIRGGHRNVVFISGAEGSSSQIRERGFRQAVDEAAGEGVYGQVIVADGWLAEHGYAAAQQLIAAKERPTGLVAANSIQALGVLGALSQAGIRVPDDLSVIAVHDVWFAPFLVPALSTVALPMFELGRSAVKQLMMHLSGTMPPELTIQDPPPQLILRGSTRKVAPRR